MHRMYGKIMQGSYYGDIAVALESLGDYSAEYLTLEIYVAVGDDYAYKYSSAHALTSFASLVRKSAFLITVLYVLLYHNCLLNAR